MKEVLHNLVLLDSIKFCKDNNIDCSDTYLVKYPRGWTYALCKNTGGAVVTTTLYKNRVPSHFVHHYKK